MELSCRQVAPSYGCSSSTQTHTHRDISHCSGCRRTGPEGSESIRRYYLAGLFGLRMKLAVALSVPQSTCLYRKVGGRSRKSLSGLAPRSSPWFISTDPDAPEKSRYNPAPSASSGSCAVLIPSLASRGQVHGRGGAVGGLGADLDIHNVLTGLTPRIESERRKLNHNPSF
ncbi:hypothetical protein BS50DRAFT_407878 [Corynespora cassiicola Philippines]|uniref:Uncharacterized protein n=1 Tax=Corynespora cassiicola Philippines TaxID=1448308 RepID=A0A2T2NL81_CORCC|nr:hypothetical protein BS50DRAFT_407878 [Corynespora cassiicola Philippines]